MFKVNPIFTVRVNNLLTNYKFGIERPLVGQKQTSCVKKTTD